MEMDRFAPKRRAPIAFEGDRDGQAVVHDLERHVRAGRWREKWAAVVRREERRRAGGQAVGRGQVRRAIGGDRLLIDALAEAEGVVDEGHRAAVRWGAPRTMTNVTMS